VDGIPVTRLMEGEQAKLIKMEERLHERVVGQDEAVEAVADAVRRARAGLKIRAGQSAHSSSWAPPA
jgi:ATP-dependent Clp protease ATP-binding subunit ClpA